jgi:cellulose synthase/poly-beta-1,6-N-acetylglucosamine synthase-like glycosyltransferase
MFAHSFIYFVFLASLAYFLALTAYYVFLAFVASMEGARKEAEGAGEDYSLVYFSTFRLPVSFVIPAHNEQEWICDCLRSILNLNYPEIEVVVVNDGSTDKTLAVLDAMLKLEPVDMMYVRHYKGGPVRKIYKSRAHPNVTVVDKESGNKKAGAVNSGLNVAKNDFICVLDADTVLERDSLLKVMAQVEKDPDHIIGVGSYFGLVNGLKVREGTVTEYSFSYNPLIAYQNIEYIRSLIGNRMGWSRYNATPNVAGGFGIWRKDILYELGGFSKDYTCEDLEFTFRAQDHAARHPEKGYRIIMLPFYAGWTEGPSNIKSLVSQRNRWQRVVIETSLKYAYMTFNPWYGHFGFLVLPYYIFYEVLGVFAEIISVAFVAYGAFAGILDWGVFCAFFLLMVLSQSFISLLCLLTFLEGERLFKPRYIAYLVFLSVVEFFWYRWIISAAKISGTWDFLRNKRSFDRYARPKRA